jgi:hypothetical protein
MRQETISLYQFDELYETVKKKILDKYRNINVDYDGWDDWVLEDWYIKLKSLGYEDAKIYFSGFWSQGDGACFTATVNIDQYLSAHKLTTRFKHLLEWADYISITITHRRHYYFARSTDVNVEFREENQEVEALLNELEAMIKKERETLGDEIYKNLEDVYCDLTSDESVAETLRINEYEFLEDGQQMNL